jgi:hypothetical protein
LHIDKPSMEEFRKTDRAKTCLIMQTLIRHKARVCPDNEDFFRRMRYVPARSSDDRMLASGRTLRECFAGVIADNGLGNVPLYQRMGLT